MSTLDAQQRWPELLVGLDQVRHTAARQLLTADWHEGFEPTREDVENLTDRAHGSIDDDKYRRRAYAAARRVVGGAHAASAD